MKLYLFIIIFLLETSGAAAEPLKVATTLSTYASITKEIGGDLVEVSSVASPRFNPHFIEPKPSDVLRLKRADLLIHSGLDLEAWREPLLDAVARSDFRTGGSNVLDLSGRVPLLEIPSGNLTRAAGDIHLYGNPHFWLDPRIGKIIAEEIGGKLAEKIPSHKEQISSRTDAFIDALQYQIAVWETSAKDLKGIEVFGYHNEWIYLVNFLGLSMKQFIEPKPGIPPTPKHLQFLEAYSKEHGIKALLQATYFPKEAGEYLQQKAGINPIPLCQSVGELAQCDTYSHMIAYNIQQIIQVLR